VAFNPRTLDRGILGALPVRPIPSARAASAQGAENKDITLQLHCVPSDASELDFVDGATHAAISCRD
jgi:hypothetical protein